MPLELPGRSFAEIAVELRNYATREAIALEAAEIFVARTTSPALAATLVEARRAAVLAGELSALFRDLIPYEREVRLFFTFLAFTAAGMQPFDTMVAA